VNTPFPFELPSPSIWYVVLYAATLLLHVAFMSYVLVGALLLGLAGLRARLHAAHRSGHADGTGGDRGALAPMARVLKDWMPSALSAAITAGIAPLLFVQILYQEEFYSANLLSFHRWMAILPVLIAAFYLLYLLKAKRIAGRPALQGAIALAITACMLFVAWSWVENHLLSLDRSAWPAQYAEKRMFYASPAVLPRLGFFVMATLPTGALLLLAQMHGGATGTTADETRTATRPLAIAAIVGTAVAATVSSTVLRGPLATAGVSEAAFGPWLAVIAGGAGCAALGWMLGAVRGAMTRAAWALAGFGTIAFWAAVILAREATRWAIAGGAAALERHGEVGTTAGLLVFTLFAAIGVGAMAWIVRVVARASRRA
jgi:hypothetical protein